MALYPKLKTFFTSHWSHLRNHYVSKLTAIFLCATILPLLIVSVIFYRINTDTSYQKIMESAQLTEQQLIQQMETMLTQMDKAADTLQHYIYRLPDDTHTSPTEIYSSFSQLRTDISYLETTFDFSHICVFLNPGSLFSKEGLMFYDLDELERFNIPMDLLLTDTYGSIWYYAPQQSYPFMLNKSYDPVNSILCIRTVKSSGDSLKYVYFVSIDAARFSDLLLSGHQDSSIKGYLLNDQGSIVSSSDQNALENKFSFTAEELEQIFSETTFTEGSSHYFPVKLSNGWYYVSDIPDSFIHSGSFSYVRTFLIILGIVLPIACFAVIYLTRSFTRRITRLSSAAAETNFDQNKFHGTSIEYVKTKPEKDYDEIDRLALTYNQMLDTIHENIDHITKLRAQEESLKYRLLQSLINPHFLYNILDSIAACNRMGKIDTSNKMIMDLTRFYRMTLRKSNELITIRDELEIATLYMELESICRGGRFTWEISMDEEIENFMICKFTLQPFLENSILHGMQGFDQHLHIHIDIRYGDDTIIILITDDGHGIEPEKLAELQHSLATGEVDTSKHFGICNVNARISSELFGHGFIEIDSTLGKGTSAKIEFQQLLP